MIPLSSIATSACTDLVRLLKDEALSGVAGKPTLKARGDKGYWAGSAVSCRWSFRTRPSRSTHICQSSRSSRKPGASIPKSCRRTAGRIADFLLQPAGPDEENRAATAIAAMAGRVRSSWVMATRSGV